jgi:hypothetical protein
MRRCVRPSAWHLAVLCALYSQLQTHLQHVSPDRITARVSSHNAKRTLAANRHHLSACLSSATLAHAKAAPHPQPGTHLQQSPGVLSTVPATMSAGAGLQRPLTGIEPLGQTHNSPFMNDIRQQPGFARARRHSVPRQARADSQERTSSKPSGNRTWLSSCWAYIRPAAASCAFNGAA